MCKKFVIFAHALIVVLVSQSMATQAQADSIINGSFETRDLTGWQSLGSVSVETEGSSGITPTNGSHQALILNHSPGNFGIPTGDVETFLGASPNVLEALSPGFVYQGSALKQTFTAKAGDVLSFDWNFLTAVENPDVNFNDFAVVTLNGSPIYLGDTFSTNIDSTSFLFLTETGYNHFSFMLPASGTFTLGFAVFDVGDSNDVSGLAVDNIASSSTAVPEPTSLIPFGTGLVTLAGYTCYRRNRAQ